MALTKPPVLPAWAEAGDKVQPSNAEIQAGWPLSNVPPSRQRFNWLLNFLANGIRYFSRRGLPDYDAAETYMTGDRIIGDDGKTYRSLIDNNTAQTPSTSPTKWEPWALTQSQSDARVQQNAAIASAAGGTADAITGSYTPGITALTNGMTLYVRPTTANATTTPTFTPNSGTIAAKQIVKGNGLALAGGDIAGAGHWIGLQYDATLDKWVLLNPANGVIPASQQTGEICYFARSTAPTGFLKANGAAVSRTTYAALFAAMNGGFSSQTFTVTIAAPGVFTKTAHGFTGGERLRLSTTGALPTGLNTTTDYYVLYIDANTFNLATTYGGTAITTTGTQSGTHSYLQSLFGLGDGSTTFNLPDLRGETVRGWDDSRGVDTGRSLGTNQKDALQNITGSFAVQDDGLPGAVLSTSGAFTSPAASSTSIFNGSSVSGTYATSFQFDASRVARTATETRSRNVALLACVKY